MKRLECINCGWLYYDDDDDSTYYVWLEITDKETGQVEYMCGVCGDAAQYGAENASSKQFREVEQGVALGSR